MITTNTKSKTTKLNYLLKLKLIALLSLLMVLFTSNASAELIMTEEEALQRAFPNHEIIERSLVLTEDQIKTVQQAARSLLPSPEIRFFEASIDGEIAGRAYLDSHVVRSEPETLLSVINANKNQLEMILLLTFMDHKDYKPSARWLKTLKNKPFDSKLQRGESIPNMVGATLTVDAIVNASRRALAIDTLIIKPSAEETK